MSEGTLWWAIGTLSPEGQLVEVRVVCGAKESGMHGADWYLGRRDDGSQRILLNNNLSAREHEVSMWDELVSGSFGVAAARVALRCVPEHIPELSPPTSVLEQDKNRWPNELQWPDCDQISSAAEELESSEVPSPKLKNRVVAMLRYLVRYKAVADETTKEMKELIVERDGLRRALR